MLIEVPSDRPFYLPEPLELEHDTVIRGQGETSVIKFAPNVRPGVFDRLITARDKCNIRIENCCLDGDGIYPNENVSQNHGIFLTLCSNVNIDNVFIKNIGGDCLHLRQCYDTCIDRCSFRCYGGNGVFITRGADYILERLRDSDSKLGGYTLNVQADRGLADRISILNSTCRNGVYFSACRNFKVLGNSIEKEFVSRMANIGIVSHNTVYNNWHDEFLVNIGFCNDIVFSNNIVTGSDGIYVYGNPKREDRKARRINIADNIVDADNHSYKVTNTEYSMMTGNVFYNGLGLLRSNIDFVTEED